MEIVSSVELEPIAEWNQLQNTDSKGYFAAAMILCTGSITGYIDNVFGVLRYHQVNSDHLYDESLLADDIQTPLGASYTYYSDTPLYHLRVLIFEYNMLPYQLDGTYLKVRYGILLQPQLNLSSYVHKEYPNHVYVCKPNTRKIIAEFRFSRSGIEVFECIH
jgi:hypothetical protein